MDRVPSTLVVIPYLKLHQALYRASGGRFGKHAGGAPALLLTTTGRRSGEPRTAALIYLRDGDDLVVVPSNGGSATPPSWLANLRADPSVTVQVGTETSPARARIASDEERDRLWPLVNRNNRGLAPVLHPGAKGRYDVYQRHTSRPIPLVILTPNPE